MAGKTLEELGFSLKEIIPSYYSVKESRLPIHKFQGVDRSWTENENLHGEVMGVGDTF